MKSAQIFIVLLIAFASASNFRRTLSTSKQMEVLAQIDQAPLTNMIMSQIQIHFAAQGVVEDLLTMVSSFIDDCNTNQAQRDAQHSEDVATCEHETTSNMASHEQHVADAATCAQTVVDTQALWDEAIAQHAVTVQNIADLQQWIAEGTATRAQQAEDYAIDQARLQKALDALDEALTLVTALYQSPASFVQLSSKLETTTNKLQELSAHLEGLEFYKPIVESLVQIAAGNMQSNAVKDIIDLLQKLRAQMQDEKDQATAVENTRIAEWAALLQKLTTQLNNAVDMKASLENAMVNYENVIDVNNQAHEMHVSEADKFLTLYNGWVAHCDLTVQNYEDFTAQNQADLEVLTRLNQYLVDNLGTVEDYLVDRVDA